MLTSANGESGRKPRGRRACLEVPSRVAGAIFPGSTPQGRGPPGLPGNALIQGHPSALSCPSVGLPQGRILSKDLTAPCYYFCEQ